MVDLKTLRLKKGVSQQDVAQYLEVSRQAYGNYENGKRQPDLEVLLKLAEYYDTTVDALLRHHESSSESQPTTDEWALIQKIRTLDEHGKKMVTFTIEQEAIRVLELAASKQIEEAEKIIPLFGTSAAAGPGEPDTDNPWEDYASPAKIGADFAVRISGDSMEPLLQDGEIALCEKRKPDIGEIAVIMVNGALLVKQYIKDYYGNVYLRSLNRSRKECDYDIMSSGNDTVTCYGVVITSHKIPLVDQ